MGREREPPRITQRARVVADIRGSVTLARETSVQDSDSMTELLRITRCASTFDEVANLLVLRVRAALQVPSRADEETEAQFRQLREKLDAHFPRFRAMYARLLAAHLKAEPADIVEGLRSEAMQRFFAASTSIHRTLAFELQQLAAEMAKTSLCN